MYETPELECYGTFRELTKGGGMQFVDPFGPNNGNPGCIGVPGGIVCLS